MKKYKLSLLTISLLLSFNALSSEVSNVDNISTNENKGNFQIKKEKELSQSAESRSKLRNEKSQKTLEGSNLETDIENLKKNMEIKKLKYQLENIPAEELHDIEGYLRKKDKEEQDKIKEQLPVLQEQVKTKSNVFPQETYDIDQNLLIPQIKKQTVQELPKPIKKFVKQEDLQNTITLPIKMEEKPVSAIEDQNKTLVDLSKDKEKISSILSPEEQKKLEEVFKQKNKIEDKKEVKKPEPVKVIPKKNYAEVRDINLHSVFIFGDKSTATFTMSVYIGNGEEGKVYTDTIEAATVGQEIIVGDYKFLIKSIDKNYVSIQNLSSKKMSKNK